MFRSPLARKETEVRPDAQASSSDGGSMLLMACDHALGLTDALAASLRDPRQPGKIPHTFQAHTCLGTLCGSEVARKGASAPGRGRLRAAGAPSEGRRQD